ncbi:MAG: septation protein A, partial [Nitrosomonas sp.]|nr:septation protein A [Nitrosomonas sp.]
FGFMGLMFAFVILQAILLGKYVEKSDDQEI